MGHPLTAAPSARMLLSHQHQPSVHQEISGHLRSVHLPSAQPAKAAPIRTGGLRRMVTAERVGQYIGSIMGV